MKDTGKKEVKAWHYVNGVKKEFKYTPSGRLSKLGELMQAYPDGLGVIHNYKAVMR